MFGGGDGGVRQELAAGIGRVLIDAQIASTAWGCPKVTRYCRRSGVQFKVEATPYRTHGQAAVWAAPLSDRFYTPTLIRPDNEREEWVMSHKIDSRRRRIHSGAA